MIDGTGAIYTESETEPSWSIRLGVVWNEN